MVLKEDTLEKIAASASQRRWCEVQVGSFVGTTVEVLSEREFEEHMASLAEEDPHER